MRVSRAAAYAASAVCSTIGLDVGAIVADHPRRPSAAAATAVSAAGRRHSSAGAPAAISAATTCAAARGPSSSTTASARPHPPSVTHASAAHAGQPLTSSRGNDLTPSPVGALNGSTARTIHPSVSGPAWSVPPIVGGRALGHAAQAEAAARERGPAAGGVADGDEQPAAVA